MTRIQGDGDDVIVSLSLVVDLFSDERQTVRVYLMIHSFQLTTRFDVKS